MHTKMGDIDTSSITTRPHYYATDDGHDLIWMFENGLMNKDEAVGFLKGNIFKYVKRFESKNGLEDLYKAREYLNRLINLVGEENG